MNTKTIKIIYWALLVLFCAFHVMDAIGGIMMAKAGVDAMHIMELPAYLMPFLGVLKLLGIAALLQDHYKTVKEWAFAGFSFSLIGAAVSHIAVNDKALFIILPVVFLAILLAIYYCWRKLGQLKTA